MNGCAYDKNDLIEMEIFCDSTDLFTEKECDLENLTYMCFPRQLVKEYYESELDDDNKLRLGFEEWLQDYTADETEYLYEFCLHNGFQGKREEVKIETAEDALAAIHKIGVEFEVMQALVNWCKQELVEEKIVGLNAQIKLQEIQKITER